jgi:hypothetical protein
VKLSQPASAAGSAPMLAQRERDAGLDDAHGAACEMYRGGHLVELVGHQGEVAGSMRRSCRRRPRRRRRRRRRRRAGPSLMSPTWRPGRRCVRAPRRWCSCCALVVRRATHPAGYGAPRRSLTRPCPISPDEKSSSAGGCATASDVEILGSCRFTGVGAAWSRKPHARVPAGEALERGHSLGAALGHLDLVGDALGEAVGDRLIEVGQQLLPPGRRPLGDRLEGRQRRPIGCGRNWSSRRSASSRSSACRSSGSPP